MTFSFTKHATLAAGVLVALTACVGAARGGEWRLDPRLCPDLREDVRDRAVDRSRRDVREDRRDSRRVTCPASAWVYHPGARPRARAATRAVYSGPTVIYIENGAYFFTPPGAKNRRRVTVVVR